MSYAARFTTSGAVDLSILPPAAAIPGSLVMAPGVYSYNGTAYDCTAEGLYRWLVFNTDTTNRVVYQSDIHALASALSWLTTHGRSDESLTLAQMEARARTSKLRLRCGPCTDFVRHIMGGQGLTTRTIRHLTMQVPEAPWAGLDEGHVSQEVLSPSGWLHFDINNGCYLRSSGGAQFTARQLSAALASDAFEIVELDADAGYEAQPFASGQFDITGWKEIVFARPDGLRNWLRRIYQATGWDHPNGEVWWVLPTGSEGRASWVTGLQANYRVKTQAEVDAFFYA